MINARNPTRGDDDGAATLHGGKSFSLAVEGQIKPRVHIGQSHSWDDNIPFEFWKFVSDAKINNFVNPEGRICCNEHFQFIWIQSIIMDVRDNTAWVKMNSNIIPLF
jgi:hypothetical protein